MDTVLAEVSEEPPPTSISAPVSVQTLSTVEPEVSQEWQLRECDILLLQQLLQISLITNKKERRMKVEHLMSGGGYLALAIHGALRVQRIQHALHDSLLKMYDAMNSSNVAVNPELKKLIHNILQQIEHTLRIERCTLS